MLYRVAVNIKWRPCLAHGHDFQAININMRGQRGEIVELLGNIFGLKRRSTAIQSIGGFLIAFRAHQGEFGFRQAWGKVGNPYASA